MTPGLDTRQMLEVHALLRLTRGVASRLAAVRRASRAGDSEPGGDVGRLVGARDPDAGYEPGCEAVAVGSAYALEEGDLVGPSRRDLGARLARGLTPRECFAEVLGREIGEAHAGDDDRSPRRPGGTGIVAGLGVAADLVSVMAGCALALRMQGRDRACLTFVEESATRAGGFHEGLNFAAVRKLPVIVVIENDAFPREDLDFNAAGEPARGPAARRPGERAAGSGRAGETAGPPSLGPLYGCVGERVDGRDVRAVHAATRRALARARDGEGPTVIEAGAFAEDATSPRETGTQAAAPGHEPGPAAGDPIALFEEQLVAGGIATREALARTSSEIESRLDDDLAWVMQRPAADPRSAAAPRATLGVEVAPSPREPRAFLTERS